jgi:hypothetical protein
MSSVQRVSGREKREHSHAGRFHHFSFLNICVDFGEEKSGSRCRKEERQSPCVDLTSVSKIHRGISLTTVFLSRLRREGVQSLYETEFHL